MPLFTRSNTCYVRYPQNVSEVSKYTKDNLLYYVVMASRTRLRDMRERREAGGWINDERHTGLVSLTRHKGGVMTED